MNIIGLFDKYLLILVIIQGLITSFIDYKSFKKAGMNRTAKTARFIGSSEIIISFLMYLIATKLY